MDNTGRMSGTINKQWFLYQEKEVFQDKRQKKLILGIPNELEKGENRICLTPESVHILVSMGHEVLIQRGAGNNAYYGDTEYADAGAMIVETLGEGDFCFCRGYGLYARPASDSFPSETL